MDIFEKWPATPENPNGFSREPIKIDNYMSYSRVKEMAKSMAHFKRRYIDGIIPEDTPEKLYGRTLHSILLEPDKFSKHHRIWPAKDDIEDVLDTVADLKAEYSAKGIKAPTRAKKEDLEDGLVKLDRFYRTRIWRFIKEDFEKNLTKDSIAVTNRQAEMILASIKAIDDKVIDGGKKAKRLLCDGIAEPCAYWQDEEFGVTWFIRIDYIRILNDSKAWITDVKSTIDASPDGFGKEKAKFFYYFQNWIYRRVVEGITGFKTNVTQLAIEKEEPIGVGVYEPHFEEDESAEEEIRYLLAEWRACMELNRWPKYAEKITLARIPMYHRYKMMARMGQEV